MSKAILVLDEMPSKCNECPLLNYIRFDCIDYCKCMVDKEHREISLHSAMKFISPWCPLKEMPYNYEDAFKIACELLNGAFIGGIDKDDIFERMMDKDGFVSSESYEKFILEHIDQMA